MAEWKTHTFLEEITKRSKHQHYQNIISLGDADYEYNALLNLYNSQNLPHKYLKSIKFIRSHDYMTVVEQINLIYQNISELCLAHRHIDVMFEQTKNN